MESKNGVFNSSIGSALTALILIGATLGCTYFPSYSYDSPAAKLNSTIQAEPIKPEQEITVTPAQVVTFSTPGAVSTQPQAVATILPADTQAASTDTEIPIQDLIWEMLGKVNIERALNDLKQLTGEIPICTGSGCFTITNRLTGSTGLDWAREYVYEELVNLGYSVEVQNWSLSGYADQNIIATKPGETHPEEKIYVIAHLDSANSPAADDNGSGVVDLLELARVFSGSTFSRTVVLLFSTGEEQGTLGVESYLSQLSLSELSAIQYAVNIDMIGYDANQDSVMELWHADDPPSLALTQTMMEIIQAYQFDLSPSLVVGCG